jgi:hypothetical protein
MALVLAFGAGQALAESTWYHDSNGELVINVEGVRRKFSRSDISTENSLALMRRWFHDEDSDTIVCFVAQSHSGDKGTNSTM